MRTIKFRAWSVASKQWLLPSEHYLVLDGRGLVYNYENLGIGILGDDISDKTIVVQQFTGLVDKNKKEIYEGDIVKYMKRGGICEDPDVYIDAVTIEPSLHISLDRVINSWNYLYYPFEVIGNIYETPELIK